MKSVFVVLAGERHEGAQVMSVHKSFEGAYEAALKVETCFGGGWKKGRRMLLD
jgi:hypothetical protein